MQKDFSKINVLVVDDMATAREYISKQLRDIGVINISTASSIVDAFKKINDRIHLIICDYYLGDGRNGKDFIEELRKEEKIPDSVVCVMVTAEARFASVIGTAENGIDGYFLKPWNPEDFREKIQKMIEKKEILTPIYTAIAKENFETAFQICNRYLSNKERYGHLEFPLRKLRADTLVSMGLFLSAIDEYDCILKKDTIPWAFHGKAKCFIKVSRYEEAEKILISLIEKFPHYMACYDDLAELYESQEDYQKQETIIQKAIEKSEEKFHRHKKLAQVALRNDHPELAQSMLETLHKKGLHSSNVDTSSMYLYARMLRLGGKEKEATEFLTSLKGAFRTERDKLASIRALSEVYQGVKNISLPIQELPPEVRLDYAIQHHQNGNDILLEEICSSIPPELMGVIGALYPNIPDTVKNALEKSRENQQSNKTQGMKDSIKTPLGKGDWDMARKNILGQLDEVKKHSDLIEMTILFFCRYVQKSANATADKELISVFWGLLLSVSQDEKQMARCKLAMTQSGISH